MPQMEYRITTEYIELNQLLKVCGLADSGGAGGAMVTAGGVSVDGQAESRKRCKIRPGQIVTFGDASITVLAADPAEVAAKAEARVAMAREKAVKKRAKALSGAMPFNAKKKAKPKARPKSGSPAPGSDRQKKPTTGNVFADKAESHRRNRKP
jgi:ribosome-associated protein